jgi:hypothetical protein
MIAHIIFPYSQHRQTQYPSHPKSRHSILAPQLARVVAGIMSFSDANALRFQIVSACRLVDAHPRTAALKPFAPVVQVKEVKLKFTISLERVCFSFDGTKMPNLKSADWKPSYATASWVFWSKSVGKKDGEVVETFSTTPSKDFDCKQAAEVTSAGEATRCLCATWQESQCTAFVAKPLMQKPGSTSFEDKFIEITVCAADQQPHKENFKVSKVRDQKSKEIILGAPVRVNLAVHWRCILALCHFCLFLLAGFCVFGWSRSNLRRWRSS